MPTATTTKPPAHVFTPYQKFLIGILALMQFTIVLDFMVMAPLGAMLMRILQITPAHFGVAVSAYAFSAGISGILAAGFADRFDRKRMLLFFYAGFTIGTFLCGIAPSYEFLVAARIITGMFGGVIGSIGMAIVADMFPLSVRGRVMGITQTSFAASQVLGIPIGIYLANTFGWHAPFLMIVGICLATAVGVIVGMKPVRDHLAAPLNRNAFQHLWQNVNQGHYMRAFTGTALLSVGGFLMLPFSSAFMVHNVGVAETQLPIVFGASGIVGMILGPMIGKMSDTFGKYRMFIIGSIVAGVMVIVYTHLSITPLWLVIILNMIMFAGVASRFIPTFALISAMPAPQDRGAFMSINSSIQQMGGGIASVIGGFIIAQSSTGMIVNFDILGYVTLGAFVVCAVQLKFVDTWVRAKHG